MNDHRTSYLDPQTLAAALEERRNLIEQHLAVESELLESAASRRAEKTTFWENLIAENTRSAQSRQLSSYRSMAGAMATLLGGSIRDQAKVMVPFEIAEATRELARFFGSRDPSALASSLKHAAAAKQYAAVAKAGGGHGGGSSSGPAPRRASGRKDAEPDNRGQRRVIVNVGRQVGIVDTYEFARNLIGAINENLSDDVILEVSK